MTININPEENVSDDYQGNIPEKIDFPITYVLKVVTSFIKTKEQHQKEIEDVFLRQKVPFDFLIAKKSSKETYISFSIRVTLINKLQMDHLYQDLGKLPGVKLAL
jgi:putative lipoic acid-binding regulatory protein